MTRSSSPREPRRRSDGARRRDEILAAALRCFDRGGLLGVGIEDIRREAGASPSSVYNLFSDVEAIVLALLERVFEALFAHMAERVTRARTAREVVHALVDSHIEWVAAHPEQARFMYQAMTVEARGLPEDAQARLNATKAAALEPILAHVQPFIDAGRLPPWSPTLLDVVLLGAAHEALRRWLAGAEELAPDRLRALLPELAWDSVRRRCSSRSVGRAKASH